MIYGIQGEDTKGDMKEDSGFPYQWSGIIQIVNEPLSVLPPSFTSCVWTIAGLHQLSPLQKVRTYKQQSPRALAQLLPQSHLPTYFKAAAASGSEGRLRKDLHAQKIFPRLYNCITAVI